MVCMVCMVYGVHGVHGVYGVYGVYGVHGVHGVYGVHGVHSIWGACIEDGRERLLRCYYGASEGRCSVCISMAMAIAFL
jgi:hypothetical protein